MGSKCSCTPQYTALFRPFPPCLASTRNFFNSLLGQDYVSKPAKHYFEEAEGWNVKYVQFKYGETKIDVGSEKDVEIFDASIKEWVELEVDFSRIEYRFNLGVGVLRCRSIL
jgi:hypothetical protein